jgi:hypothetical protein
VLYGLLGAIDQRGRQLFCIRVRRGRRVTVGQAAEVLEGLLNDPSEDKFPKTES